MTNHRALVVEDDAEIAQDLTEILMSLRCDSRVTDNARDALRIIQQEAFCFVLLDLQIKIDPGAIKGHVEHGRALLRDIRKLHPYYTGMGFWLPIVIVSGFARERAEAMEVMKSGADDIVEKPVKSAVLSEVVRHVLDRSGRRSHVVCNQSPRPIFDDSHGKIVLAIPGDRERRRTRILVAGKPLFLTDSMLRLLLRLMIARVNGNPVHKQNLGFRRDQGFKGISTLRAELKPLFPHGFEIIGNDYNGNYWMGNEIVIGACNDARLSELGDKEITDLSRQLTADRRRRKTKSEGNS